MKVDYLMVGGFLGAGKTTAMLRLARHLAARGRRVGLIVNDQSHGLADTVLAAAQGFVVEEITGGCFCCRFDALTEAVKSLASKMVPDTILAEPVGSCTDLRATVQYPLRQLHGAELRVGPLSVLVDPLRALRVLGLVTGNPFSEKVLYVYGKQLEEADIIVINKCDLLPPEEADRLEEALRRRYPGSAMLRVSARAGTGLAGWFAALGAEAGTKAPPEVDYDRYAEGEAQLGWLNGAVHLSAPKRFDGNLLLLELARRIQMRLATESIEIAHLKMTLIADGEADRPAALHLVSTAGKPEMPRRLARKLAAGDLLLNLRAEGNPDVLREAVEAGLAATGIETRILRLDHFRPARPTPTHRVGAG